MGIVGEAEIADHVCGGQGHQAKYTSPGKVAEVARALEHLDVSSLRRHYDLAAMEAQGVYKAFAGRETPEDWAYLSGLIEGLWTFYLEAASCGDGVLVCTDRGACRRLTTDSPRLALAKPTMDDRLGVMKSRCATLTVSLLTLAVLLARSAAAAEPAPQRADPIPPPPADRSSLPPPREGVVMVRVQKDGRLNVQLGGWGGERLIQAKTDPEKFRELIRAVKGRGLNTVRPLFHPPNAANKNDANWAKFDWEAMDRAVALTQEEGVYFLVDYHNWGVNDTLHADEKTWLQNWGWIFDRYKPYKHLIFEGFNEPQNQCPDLAEHYQKWIDLARSKGIEQLCVVSPFWGKYFAVKDPANNWAQCRHHYFAAGNSASPEKAGAAADWHLTNLQNKNSAASAVNAFGCGFFMTEGGIEDKPKTEAELAARVVGVQRVIDDCEKNGYGWCLWAWGDWADGLRTYGARLTTKANYPLITGERPAKE